MSLQRSISPSLYWFFTFNNYNEKDIESVIQKCEILCEWYVFQEETGEEGTKHLQGTIKLKTKGRPVGLFNIPQIHWEKTKSIKNSIEYCSKKVSKSGLLYTNIILPKPLKLLDEDNLYNWQKNIINLIKTEPDDRTIHWYWDSNGCTGKTALAKLLCHKYNALCISGKASDCKHGIVEYFKKNNMYPIIVILNVPRSNIDYVSYEAIESIKDGLFFSGKYESGQVIMNSPHLIIFANNKPDTRKLSQDRWHIVEIDTCDP